MPETTRDRADVTARPRPDKPGGAYSTRPGLSPAMASSIRCFEGSAAKPKARGSRRTAEYTQRRIRPFRRARQQLFDFHRDAIAADDDHAARHRHVVGQNADLVLLGQVEFDNGAAAEPQT